MTIRWSYKKVVHSFRKKNRDPTKWKRKLIDRPSHLLWIVEKAIQIFSNQKINGTGPYILVYKDPLLSYLLVSVRSILTLMVKATSKSEKDVAHTTFFLSVNELLDWLRNLCKKLILTIDVEIMDANSDLKLHLNTIKNIKSSQSYANSYATIRHQYHRLYETIWQKIWIYSRKSQPKTFIRHWKSWPPISQLEVPLVSGSAFCSTTVTFPRSTRRWGNCITNLTSSAYPYQYHSSRVDLPTFSCYI